MLFSAFQHISHSISIVKQSPVFPVSSEKSTSIVFLYIFAVYFAYFEYFVAIQPCISKMKNILKSFSGLKKLLFFCQEDSESQTFLIKLLINGVNQQMSYFGYLLEFFGYFWGVLLILLYSSSANIAWRFLLNSTMASIPFEYSLNGSGRLLYLLVLYTGLY